MDREMIGNKLTVGIYGKRSSGKSRLMNNVIGQNISVVSKVKGTTTDPVSKTVELGKLGKVVFTDTAGIDDAGVVGEQRVQKTMATLEHIDLAIYVMDSEDIDEIQYLELVEKFAKYEIPHILVFNKADKVYPDKLNPYRKRYGDALFMSAKNMEDINRLKVLVEVQLGEIIEKGQMLEGLSFEGKGVLIVTSGEVLENEKSSLIYLQLVKEAVEKDSIASFISLKTLDSCIEDYSLVVVEDSAVEGLDLDRTGETKITTVAVLCSRSQETLGYFLDSTSKLDSVGEISKILCYSADGKDIEKEAREVRRKISNYTGKTVDYDLAESAELPEDISTYDMVVQFGQETKKKNISRKLNQAKHSDVFMTNAEFIKLHTSGKLKKVTGFLEI